MRSQTQTLARCRNFEAAQQMFRHAKPRSAKWGEHQRPLGSNQQLHYRVERVATGGAGGMVRYETWLYNTCMARYYAPDAQGTHVYYRWHSTQTSKAFLWNVCGVSETLTRVATDGTTRRIPLLAGSVDLRFDKNGWLRVEESTHSALSKRVASPDDKAALAAYRAQIRTHVMCAAVRYVGQVPKLQAAYADKNSFGAFTGPDYPYGARHVLFQRGVMDDAWLEAFMACAKAMVWHAQGVALYNERPLLGLDALAKRIERGMVQLSGVARKSLRMELPLFPIVEP